MLAYRRTWHVKLGCMDEALELIHQAVDEFKERGAIGRAYSPHISPADIIVWEEDWESAEDHDQFWAGLGEGTKEWFQNWFKVVERGGSQEVWNLRA
jgi:hypothetical protein